jgi:hypothetical protein
MFSHLKPGSHEHTKNGSIFLHSSNFFGQCYGKIGRKDRKIPICPSEFFSIALAKKNWTDAKKPIRFLYVRVNEASGRRACFG